MADNESDPSNTALTLAKINLADGLLSKAIKTAGQCFIAYMTYRIVAVTAGKTTHVNYLVALYGHIAVSKYGWAFLAGGTTASGILYGKSQKRLKEKQIKNNNTHIVELERSFDPFRTSSGLTATGSTNPEDQA